MKNASGLWVLGVGLFCVAAQIILFYARFGRWNTDATFTEYLLFFLAGAIGGWILTFFLNRYPSSPNRQAIWVAFLLASPFALLLMLAGGILGPLGVLILPQIPWTIFTWVGAWVGKRLSSGLA